MPHGIPSGCSCWLPGALGWWMEQDKESCCTQMQSDSKLKHENFAQGLFTCWHYLACAGSLQGFGLQAMRGEPWTPIGIRGRGCCLAGRGVAVPLHCCAWRVLPPPALRGAGRGVGRAWGTRGDALLHKGLHSPLPAAWLCAAKSMAWHGITLHKPSCCSQSAIRGGERVTFSSHNS